MHAMDESLPDESEIPGSQQSRASILVLSVWYAGCFAWAWTLMLLLHELGHILAAWLTGGVVVQTNLLPWALPYTLIEPNPHPHLVAWGGIVFGVAIPLLLWQASRFARGKLTCSLAGLTSWCLLANGSYLAVGGSESLTDTGVLTSLGWRGWLLVVIGVLLAIPGYLGLRQQILREHARWERCELQMRHVVRCWLGWFVWMLCQTGLAISLGAAGS